MPYAVVMSQIRAAAAANDCGALIRLAATHVADAGVLVAALEAIGRQAQSEPDEHDTVALVEVGARALRHHADNPLVAGVVCALLIVRVGQNGAHESRVTRSAVDAGVCEVLLAALNRFQGKPDLQVVALAVLSNVAMQDAEGRARALRAGAVSAIMATVKSAPAVATLGGLDGLGQPYSGLVALGTLLSDCQTAGPQEEAYALGAVTAALAAMHRWPKNALINAQACGCLLSLLLVPRSCTREPVRITAAEGQAALDAVLAALFEHATDAAVATNACGALCALMVAMRCNFHLSPKEPCPLCTVLLAQRAHPARPKVQAACLQALIYLFAPVTDALRKNTALRLGVAAAAEAAAVAFPHLRPGVDDLLALFPALDGDTSTADGAVVIRTRTALAEVAAARAACEYETLAQIAVEHAADPVVLIAVLEALFPVLNQSPTPVLPERTCSAFADAGLAALHHHAGAPDQLCQACGLLSLAVAHPAVATRAINDGGLADALAAVMRRHADFAQLQGAGANVFEQALQTAAGQANVQILVRVSVPELLVAALILDTAKKDCKIAVMNAFTTLLYFASREASATIRAATLARAVPALAALMRETMDKQETLRDALVCLLRCMPKGTTFPELHPAVAADALNAVQAVLLAPQHAGREEIHSTGCSAINRLATYAADGEQTSYDADAAAGTVLASLRKHKAVTPQYEGLCALTSLLRHPRGCSAAVRRACSDASAAALREHPSGLVPTAHALSLILSVTAESGGVAPLCGRPECGLLSGNGVKLRLCAGCRGVRYCSDACQRAHWSAHKAACRASAAAAAAV